MKHFLICEDKCLVEGLNYNDLLIKFNFLASVINKLAPDTYLTDYTDYFNSHDKTPVPDTILGTNFTRMFMSWADQTIPNIDTRNGVYFNNMCSNSESLIKMPALELGKGEGFSAMFAECPIMNSDGDELFYQFLTTPSESIPADLAQMVKDQLVGVEHTFDNIFEVYFQIVLNSAPDEETKQSILDNRDNIYKMFANQYGTHPFPQLDLSNGISFNGMFMNTPMYLRDDFPNIDTGKGVLFNSMFYGTYLTVLPDLDVKNGTNFDGMFVMPELRRFRENPLITETPWQFGEDVSFSECPLLEVDSIKKVIDGLKHVANKRLTLYKDMEYALPQEYKEKAQNKGWTLYYEDATYEGNI